jgi:hypothetical protein
LIISFLHGEEVVGELKEGENFLPWPPSSSRCKTQFGPPESGSRIPFSPSEFFSLFFFLHRSMNLILDIHLTSFSFLIRNNHSFLHIKIPLEKKINKF